MLYKNEVIIFLVFCITTTHIFLLWIPEQIHYSDKVLMDPDSFSLKL